MKNFIFKSSERTTDLQKMFVNKLEAIQSEQRHARADLAYIIRHINRTTVDENLQKQVDQYFEDDETSPQTEQKQNGPSSSN